MVNLLRFPGAVTVIPLKDYTIMIYRDGFRALRNEATCVEIPVGKNTAAWELIDKILQVSQ